MDGLRTFIAVDKYGAVKVGGLHQDTKSLKVVRSKFTADFPGAVIREAADELTLRAQEEGVLRTFIDTTTVEGHRWELFSRALKDSGKPCIATTRTCTRL